MINFEKLLENKIISKEQFLLNYYSLININETELVIILLIENMLSSNKLVTVQELEKKMNISSDIINKAIKRLIQKKYLSFDPYSSNNSIDTSFIYEKIVDQLTKDEIASNEKNKTKNEGNLIKMFEKEFKRNLSPFEIETIREWSTSFSEELIIYSLREAVLNGVINLKYIEKIIVEQAKIING
ncbi:DNA replication protein [Bacilli bacterium PM5-3]|nr:DNA replication protein [Bacilli bacterium PM5-3]MDH6603053.1 DNA replication protein [Bacilli bacterium PM5-9]